MNKIIKALSEWGDTWSCWICGSPFPSQSALSAHLNSHY